MPFNPDGSFTDVTGATNAVPGEVIHSSVWNAINSDYQTGLTALGQRIVTLTFVIDGGGAVLTTGTKGDLILPFAVTLTQVTLLADQPGNVVADVLSGPYSSYPPVTSITGASPPTISASNKSQDSVLTGWTTAIPAGNVLQFNINSCSAITRLTVALRATRTVP